MTIEVTVKTVEPTPTAVVAAAASTGDFEVAVFWSLAPWPLHEASRLRPGVSWCQMPRSQTR